MDKNVIYIIRMLKQYNIKFNTVEGVKFKPCIDK